MRLSNRPPYRSQRCFGAIALEWCWLAAGRAHLNLHGGQKLWDYAAGRLIFSEAGGVFNKDSAEQVRLGLAVQPAWERSMNICSSSGRHGYSRPGFPWWKPDRRSLHPVAGSYDYK